MTLRLIISYKLNVQILYSKIPPLNKQLKEKASANINCPNRKKKKKLYWRYLLATSSLELRAAVVSV